MWIWIRVKIGNALVWNILDQSQRKFAHVTTGTLSWHVQNFVVIGRAHFKPEHCKICSNFEFDRNIVSGTGASRCKCVTDEWVWASENVRNTCIGMIYTTEVVRCLVFIWYVVIRLIFLMRAILYWNVFVYFPAILFWCVDAFRRIKTNILNLEICVHGTCNIYHWCNLCHHIIYIYKFPFTLISFHIVSIC